MAAVMSDGFLEDCSVCGAVGPDYCRRARCEDPRYVEGGEREENAAFNNAPLEGGAAAGESPRDKETKGKCVNLTDLPADLRMAILTLGAKDEFSTERTAMMAATANLIRTTRPQAEIVLTIGGYDDDPRELWEIAEARECVCKFAFLAGLAIWPEGEVERVFEQSALELMVACTMWTPDLRVMMPTTDDVGHG